MEATLGKIKSKRRGKSVSSRRGSDDSAAGKLSNLLPSRMRSKSKGVAGGDALERRPSTSSSNPNLALPGNTSSTSLDNNGSGNSSLFTDDSLEAEPKLQRPILSSHDSHAGYLTLTSPEINAAQIVTNGSSIPLSEPTTNIPQIVEPPSTEPEDTNVSKDRNISPVGKLRAKLSRKRSNSSLGSERSQFVGKGALSEPISRSSSISPTPGVDLGHTVDAAQLPKLQDTTLPDLSPERPTTPKSKSSRPRVSAVSGRATPPSAPGTPQTLVTPPTPTDSTTDVSTFPEFVPSAARISSPTRTLTGASHRRSQSANVPSKLSQSIAPPLTPTTEEVKTPGGTLSTGFFSSFFTAAQKASGQFTLGGGAQSAASKTAEAQQAGSQGDKEGAAETESQLNTETGDVERGRSIVEVPRKGDLPPGTTNDTTSNPMASTTELAQDAASITIPEASQAEEDAANRAVSAAYEKPSAPVSQVYKHSRAPSVASNDQLTLGEQSPLRPGVEADSIKRSGSVRSKFSGRRRRHRNSSATAGSNSIGAALAASATGLANPAIHGAGHRLTGFAVASNKRNRDFHSLFRSVPEDDYLIEDYSAALQRDILLHGRLYVSEGHICFSSNILGWVTNLVVSFDEVVSVEKKSTAVIFPNAIVIQTLHARNTFASFVARDSTYELLIGIWKISHPNLKSSLNGVTLDNAGTGDKTEVAEAEGSDGEEDDTGSEDEVYDEDEEDGASLADAATAPSYAGSDAGDSAVSRKPSGAALGGSNAPAPSNGAPKAPETADAAATGPASSTDFPGPMTHEPTSCADEHYDRSIADATIGAPLGKVYSLMFGPASGAFMKKWLVDDQKSRELNYQDDKTGIDNEHKTFTFDYIKPLNAPVGPKQTKTITTNNILSFDLEKAVCIDCSTSTPDVPSGGVFVVKTRYCLMWAPGNSTRVVATCTIEWSGKSWLKGPIEKGANDGQVDYVKSLVAALNASVASKGPTAAGGKSSGKKGKRKGKKEALESDAASTHRGEPPVVADTHKSNWGPLEPIHALLDPIFSLVRPFITPQVIIAVLFVLLVYSWLNPPRRSSSAVGFVPADYTTDPRRLPAYEEMWRSEESRLWEWLEDRVGLEGGYVPGVGVVDGDGNSRQKVLKANTKNMGKRLEDERMTERQMDDAIRVTAERLESLKMAVERKKEKKQASGSK